MTTPPIEERLTRLEARQQHLATKADLAELKAEIRADLASYKVETIKWVVGVGIGSAAAVSFTLLMQRIFG